MKEKTYDAFVAGDNNHLYACRWDGRDDLLRNDFGEPTLNGHDVIAQSDSGDTLIASAPGAVTFAYVEPGRTTDRIYAFVRGEDGHLHQCYWNGVDLWLWNDLANR